MAARTSPAVEGYSLIGESSQLPTGEAGAGLPTIDLRYAGVQTIPIEASPTCFEEPSPSCCCSP